MGRFVKSILGLAFVLVLTSCATTATIETNKSPAYDEQLSKLYILVNVGDWEYEGDKLGDYLAANLEKKLQENGILTKASRVSGVELDEDRYKKEMGNFGATRMMDIELSGGVVNPSNEVVHGTFDISILDVSNIDASKYPMAWRAKITVDGGHNMNGTYSFAANPDKVLESIISALQKDGLVKQGPAESK